MKNLLVMAGVVALLALTGCNRCDMWDFYCPCDLVEGQACRKCVQNPVYGPYAVYGQKRVYRPGMVVERRLVGPCQAPTGVMPGSAPTATAPMPAPQVMPTPPAPPAKTTP